MLPLFPTTVVGSWPRPRWLLQAFDDHAAGRMDRRTLTACMNDAVLLALKEQEDAGVNLVSDGEQRRFSFLAVIGEKVAGFRLMNILELARNRPAVLSIIERMMLPQTVPQPIAVAQLVRRKPIAVDELEFARRYTGKPVKVPLPSPYMLAWQAWDARFSRDAYPTYEDLADALCRILRAEILALKAAGAVFIQLDDPTFQNPLNPEKYMRFLTRLLGHRPRPWKEELAWAVELVNRTIQGILGVTLGFHVCRGNWPAPEAVLPTGAYGPILPALLELKVDQLVLEFATPRAGTVDVFREYPTTKQLGLGVIEVKNPRVETVEEIVQRVERALRYFAPAQLYLNPDCGFASGRTWPVADRRTAGAKLQVMAAAARWLRHRYRS